jgi:hypothetical protein
MYRICAVALCCLSVAAGCSPEYRARMQAQAAARQQAIVDADDAQCRSHGADRGSNSYVDCRVSLANNREAADEAQREAWLRLGQVGLQMMTQRPAPATPASDDHVCIAANNTLCRC